MLNLVKVSSRRDNNMILNFIRRSDNCWLFVQAIIDEINSKECNISRSARTSAKVPCLVDIDKNMKGEWSFVVKESMRDGAT